ncbi:MAG: ATP-dependent DNA helicase [Flavisolibacter sp.]
MPKQNNFVTKHLSVRVPWHDNEWQGTVCNRPSSNSSCLVLDTCAAKKNEALEDAIAGTPFNKLSEDQLPPCVVERASFMSPFAFQKTIHHPYAEISPDTHGHLLPTRLNFPKYSAAGIPYSWMRKENASDYADLYELDYKPDREPPLRFEKNGKGWVQEYHNQKALLNGFFNHVEEGTSLVFFYAKQVPFYEGSGRVLVGAGRIEEIVESEEYKGSNKKFAAAYWETMIRHTIRPEFKDGFLLPYHAGIKYQELNPEFDLSSLAVVVPGDKTTEFSFVSEHVSHDSAISLLLECLKKWELAKEKNIGERHDRVISWIHNEVAKIEKLRGYYPGMGSALCAFGFERGHFIAASIINKMDDPFGNPWEIFESAIDDPKRILGEQIGSLLSAESIKLYKTLKSRNSERLQLLFLLSRFNLSINQSTILYVQEEREKFGINYSDGQFLSNPYLIYEACLSTDEPVSFSTIDLGLFTKSKSATLWPEAVQVNDANDPRRLRALTVMQLEFAAQSGHTLLPRKLLVNQIRELAITPKCETNSDYYSLAEEIFTNAIEVVAMKDGTTAYQLKRLSDCGSIIRKKVLDRLKGKRLDIAADWRQLLNEKLPAIDEEDALEAKAREEKSAALKEIAESRVSVLIGPAGTGKTTLLTILSSHPSIRDKGVLLLAPTGKARVRMEEISKDLDVTALTLAQFLYRYNRYDGYLQQYKLSDKYCEGQYETVILDECSMLTEEMLATTLDCIKQAKRIILVGDHRQLPPIGAGRPFVDIVQKLTPTNRDGIFPKVGQGYAELTVKRRQGGLDREDLQLADWFGGGSLDVVADDVFNKIKPDFKSEYLRLVAFESEFDFPEVFDKVLYEELKIDENDIEKSFSRILGSEDGMYFNWKKAVQKVEAWQILSPVREKGYGVRAINRAIHKRFKEGILKFAKEKYKIPSPVGLDEVVYGDKVINLYNRKREAWPEGSLEYVANGEIGIVIGQFKTSKHNFSGRPQNIEVEFSSQKGFKYTYKPWDFKEDGDNPLELAYALTVHKAQGSEFETVFLVVPNPCFLLTREMLYTALTRQKQRVVVLYQGSLFDIKELSSPLRSDTLRRITNLFEAPDLIERDGIYLEKNLIHQASDGKMLRSKSELMIYQRLLDKQVSPLYEKKLVIKDVEKLPDFTIENSDTGITYYWEHCGIMHNEEYRSRWNRKLEWYIENGILPHEQGGGENGVLIVTYDKQVELEDGTTAGAISVIEIDQLIDDVLLK